MSALFPGHLARRASLAGLFAIALGACGEGVSTTATEARGRVGAVVVISAPEEETAPVGDSAPPTSAEPAAPTSSRDDLHDEIRIRPLTIDVDPADPSLLRVTYRGGTGPCDGVRLAVDEGPATVRVILVAGTPPEAAGAPCRPADARRDTMREVTARLGRPLGSRELL
jgi:hypothetical protein